MSANKKSLKRIHLYLIHQETGQRYPVADDDIVIGRSGGEILFPDDTKMSGQHCRIFKTATGWSVHDLDSANGTFLNGRALVRGQMYPFTAGNRLSVGQQEFYLTEASSAKSVRRRKKQRKPEPAGLDAWSVVVVLGLAAAVALAYLWANPPKREAAFSGVIESPFQITDREVGAILDEYRMLGQMHAEKKITEAQMTKSLTDSLIPNLRSAKARLGAIRPSSEWETQKLELNKRLVNAMLGQTRAMVNLTVARSPKFESSLKKHTEELEALGQELQRLKSRQPAGR